MWHDLKNAIRTIRSTPIISTVVVLGLALGIGATTMIFSVLNALLLRPLPVKNAHQLVCVTSGDADRITFFTNPIWEQIRDQHIFADAFAWKFERFDLSMGGRTDPIDGMFASGRMFEVLGITPVQGRLLIEADDRRGGGTEGPVAVISSRLWQRRYGGAANAIGQTLTIERIPFTIVGVTPPEFSGLDVGLACDVIIPITAEPLVHGQNRLDSGFGFYVGIMARLGQSQSAETATATLRGVQAHIREKTMPNYTNAKDREEYLAKAFNLTTAATGNSVFRNRYQRPLVTILALIALLMLIACANIANLLIARTASRRFELSVRLALGATRFYLARQMLVESLLLAMIGAGFGLLFATWGGTLLVRQMSTQNLSVHLNLAPDWRVLGFTFLVGAGTALLVGTAPALRAAKASPAEAMRLQGRAIAPSTRIGLGGTLVVAQIALSLPLVVAAGLFVGTFSALASANLGFDAERLTVVTIDGRRCSAWPKQHPSLEARVGEAASSVAGVASTAPSLVMPFGNFAWHPKIEVDNGAKIIEGKGSVRGNAVGLGWFETVGTRVLKGRSFSTSDGVDAPRVAVVNETFVRRLFDLKNPLGRRMWLLSEDNQRQSIEIVGVAQDAIYLAIREPAPPTIYVPIAQAHSGLFGSGFTLSLRTKPKSSPGLDHEIAAAISQVDPTLSLSFSSFTDQAKSSFRQERLVASLAGVFGGLSLLLSALGLYGVTSHSVTRRRNEIAIRMALGAEAHTILRMVLNRVAIRTALGAAIGTLASLWAVRFANALLFGVQPYNPYILITSIVVLGATSALAAWLPARRAVKLNPAWLLNEQ